MSNHRNMIRLPFRLTNQLGDELSQAIINQVQNNQESTHPDVIKEDAVGLAKLRTGLGGTKVDVSGSALSNLIHYYAQLSFAMTKFPDELGLTFEWYPLFASPPSSASLPTPTGAFPSFGSSEPEQVTTLSGERLCIVFNIAGMFTALALESSHKDEDAFKTAIAGLQNAAGALDYLLKETSPEEGRKEDEGRRHGWSLEVVAGLRDVCLAQAQELFWQKAVMGQLKNGTVAKLAAKVGELYATALSTVAGTRPGLPDQLLNYLQIKSLHFQAVAQYRKSIDDLGSNRYGDESGRLEHALTLVKKALASPKLGVSESVRNDLKSLQAILIDNRTRATKDNDLIYLHAVTAASALPAIVPAAMVKPTTIPELLSPIGYLHTGAGGLGRPLFDQLVPIEVHLAVSVYDDRKAELLREQIVSRKDELDAVAQATLGSLGLPGSVQAATTRVGLPPSLVDQAREVRAEGGVDRLKKMLADVRQVGHVNQGLLDQAQEALNAEQTEDEAFRAKYGTDRWTRVSSHEAAAELRRRVENLAGILNSARTSDGLVRAKYAQAEPDLSVLGGGDEALAAAVPSLSATASPFASAQSGPAPEQTKAIRTLTRALDELDDIRSIRNRIVAEARQAFEHDDIRPAVMNHAAALAAQSRHAKLSVAQFEDLFQARLQGLGRFDASLTENAVRQEDLLDRIKAANEGFLHARRTDPALARREEALQRLDGAAGQHRELLANLQEGLKFYDQLSQLLGELRDACKQFGYARAQEAKDLGLRLGMGGVRISSQTQRPGVFDPSQGPIRFG